MLKEDFIEQQYTYIFFQECSEMASDGGENECLLSLVILWDTSSKHHTSDVIVSAVNATTAVFASLSNLAIFVTMIKKKLFSTPNDILIGSLTLVDCAAAIVAKPLYIALRMFLHHDQVACDSLRSLANVGESAFLFCVGCSVLHIVLIAGDRCVALCKPVGYRTTNAKKGNVCMKLFILLLSADSLWEGSSPWTFLVFLDKIQFVSPA